MHRKRRAETPALSPFRKPAMKFIVIPPEAIAKARHLYEDTGVPVADIAKMLGIGQTTLLKRAKLWGWTPRNRRLAELDAAAKANLPLEKIRAAAAPARKKLTQLALFKRVRSAVESEIVAIENVLRRVEAVHLRSTDAERAARTLATLVRTLKELAALEQPADKPTGEESQSEASDDFRDLEQFRRSLAERLDGLCAGGETG
jgi:hypothetical protein